MEIFRVIIAGGRDFDNYEYLCDKCDLLLKDKHDTHRIIIISGGAKGADSLGERYAKERGYQVDIYQAQWGRHGKAAGPIRNGLMADISDAAIVFWDGASKGSKSMVDCMEQRNKKVIVFRYDNAEIAKEQ